MLLHISDTHLGRSQYGLQERRKDLLEAFQRLIEVAISEHVDLVLHSGDLFDRPNPDVIDLAEVSAVLDKLREKGIPAIAIPGNHDLPSKRGHIYPQRFLEQIGKLRVLDWNSSEPPYKITKGGIDYVFYGIRYIPVPDFLRSLLQAVKPTAKSVLVLHQGYKEALPYTGSYQLSLSDLPKGFSYYASGHVHERVLQRREDGSVFAIAGSPEVMDVKEIEDYKRNGKGGFLVDLSSPEPLVQKFNVEVRPQEVITVDTKDLEAKVVELRRKLAPYPSKCILHFTLTGEPMDKRKVHEILSSLGDKVLSYRVDYQTSFVRGVRGGEIGGGTVTDLIKSYLRAQGYSEKETSEILEIIDSAEDEEMASSLIKRFAGVDLDSTK